MSNIFKVNETIPYDLGKPNVLQRSKPSSVRYATENISYIAPKIWSFATEIFCDILKSFKQKIRKGKSDCSCTLCKTYLQHVDFV